jgi:preprotein translocase subunit SecG
VEIVHLFLEIMLLVFSVGLILVVLLQKGKSAGLSGAISGGAEQLFGKQKARGLDLFMSRLTMVLAVGFFVTALLLSYVFTK